jgi:hypothetical protein
LGEERDIDAALSGSEQPAKWRNVLARIGRQECLGFGYAFPNHTVFKVRNYDQSLDEIWSPLMKKTAKASSPEASKKRLKDLSEHI